MAGARTEANMYDSDASMEARTTDAESSAGECGGERRGGQKTCILMHFMAARGLCVLAESAAYSPMRFIAVRW